MNNTNKVTDPLFYDYEEDVWQDIMGDDAVAAAPNNVLMPASEAQTFVETKPLQEREGVVGVESPVAEPEGEDEETDIVFQLMMDVDQCKQDIEHAKDVMWGMNMYYGILSAEEQKDIKFLEGEFLHQMVEVNKEVIKYHEMMDNIEYCFKKGIIDKDVKLSFQSEIEPFFKSIKKEFLNFALTLMEAGVRDAEEGIIFGMPTDIFPPHFREKSFETFHQMIIDICEEGSRVLNQLADELRGKIVHNPSLSYQDKCYFLEKILKIISVVRSESSEDGDQIYTELVEQGVDIPPFLERAARMYTRFKSLMNSCWGEMDYVESRLVVLDRKLNTSFTVADEFVDDGNIFIWEQNWYEGGMKEEFPDRLKRLEYYDKEFTKEVKEALDKVRKEAKEVAALEEGIDQLSLRK